MQKCICCHPSHPRITHCNLRQPCKQCIINNFTFKTATPLWYFSWYWYVWRANVKSLPVPKHHTLNIHRTSICSLPSQAQNETQEWSATCFSFSKPRERILHTLWIGGWPASKSSPNKVAMTEIPAPAKKLIWVMQPTPHHLLNAFYCFAVDMSVIWTWHKKVTKNLQSAWSSQTPQRCSRDFTNKSIKMFMLNMWDASQWHISFHNTECTSYEYS